MKKITLTPEQFEAKKEQLSTEHNITISAPSGTIDADGYEATYAYDGVSTLAVTVTKTPRFVPTFLAEEKIAHWFSA